MVKENVLPRYRSDCVSSIPGSVLSIFGVNHDRPQMPSSAFGDTDIGGVEKVVLFVLDGFGYNEWRRQTKEGFVGAFERKGHIAPITSVFPSTTAAALTSLNTGLTPQEHGLPEWYVYFDEFGATIVTLRFGRMGETKLDTLTAIKSPEVLTSAEPVYKRLTRAGIKCASLTNYGTVGSAYSSVVLSGSRIVPYDGSTELALTLKRELEAARGLTYLFVYWNQIDTVEHRFGPHTTESDLEAASISFVLRRGFLDRVGKKTAKQTLVMATADHGQLQIAPEETLRLNSFRKLTQNLARSDDNNLILPWGSSRDVFVRVRESRLEETIGYLSTKLRDYAHVVRVEEAITAGLFGINSPVSNFIRRVGDLMILPKGRKTLWYLHPGQKPFDMRGHHGGLTRDEMTVPFASARLSDLIA